MFTDIVLLGGLFMVGAGIASALFQGASQAEPWEEQEGVRRS